ncbi:MAG: SRPBCC family protein [Acidimicrobiales bacterium]
MTSDVVASVRIAAPPKAVFDYLVDPDKLIRWMGTEVAIDPRPGGQFRLDVNGSDVASGEYVEVLESERVSFSWGWEGSPTVPPGSSLVTIDLVEDGTETLVTLTHADLPVDSRNDHLQGWTHYVERLAVAATGSDPGPDPMVDSA